MWYLSGMIDAVTLAASNQPGNVAIFGTSTIIADLSVYASQIRAVVPKTGTFVLVAVCRRHVDLQASRFARLRSAGR